jgi:excinuclease ABC subunit C
MTHTSLAQGLETIKRYVKTLKATPGVYRMFDVKDRVLYVGKAKNLKNRVAHYTQVNRLTVRLKRMVAETVRMEFVVTASEVDALLLEANLIKHLRPPFNIRLMDDKFYSYLHLSDHLFPRLEKYRGRKTGKGQFFGPFASTGSVNQALTPLFKIFKLRSCTDSFFENRQRPCMQYHIKRCTAPCVGYISPQDYGTSVRQVGQFLRGKSSEIQQELADAMYAASQAQQYEKAATLRDQIQALTQLQATQRVHLHSLQETDILTLVTQGPKIAIHAFFFRHGSNYGSHTFFPKQTDDLDPQTLFSEFLLIFYTDKMPPSEILLNHPLDEPALIQEALSKMREKPVILAWPKRGEKAQIVEESIKNATQALEREWSRQTQDRHLLTELQQLLELPNPLERLEIYDNSHIQGSQAIGAMVVSGPQGFEKKAYRKFTIKGDDLTPGDDYGMMRQVLHRRFSGSLGQKSEANPWPSLLVIDGGPGQLSAAHETLTYLGVDIPLLAISKGPHRHAGDETFHRLGHPPFKLHDHKTVLFFLQRLRDEAHRFAITFHRARRQKALKESQLDDVPGIGGARKKALLRHFGSAQAVREAPLDDILNVPGISQSLAQKIYDFFHPD